jgi:hypothetical protein
MTMFSRNITEVHTRPCRQGVDTFCLGKYSNGNGTTKRHNAHLAENCGFKKFDTPLNLNKIISRTKNKFENNRMMSHEMDFFDSNSQSIESFDPTSRMASDIGRWMLVGSRMTLQLRPGIGRRSFPCHNRPSLTMVRCRRLGVFVDGSYGYYRGSCVSESSSYCRNDSSIEIHSKRGGLRSLCIWNGGCVCQWRCAALNASVDGSLGIMF